MELTFIPVHKARFVFVLYPSVNIIIIIIIITIIIIIRVFIIFFLELTLFLLILHLLIACTLFHCSFRTQIEL